MNQQLTRLFTITVLICVSTLLRGQDTTNVNDRLLDFWVGQWEATWDDAEGKKGHGINKIAKTLDGKVIQENFEILDGESKGYKGTSISTYHATAQKWFQAYADNSGVFYYFVGDLAGERKTFKTDVFKTKDGKDFMQRMVFHSITKETMIWDWESSIDGGKTWKLNWRINYRRVL